MAKGDSKRMQNEISSQQDLTRYGYGYKPPVIGSSGNIRSPGIPGIGGMESVYKNLYDTGPNSYNSIMDNYRNFLGRDSGARSSYAELAAGGGVNADAIRNRAMAGVRSVYANAKRNVDRNRSIQGGYSPGYNTLMSRMAREQSQGAADASTDVEAAIAELISRNRIAGAGGLANLEGIDLNTLNSMSGAQSGRMNDLFQAQSLQNQIAQMMIEARSSNSKIPSDFSQGMENTGKVIGLGSRIAQSMAGLGGGGVSAGTLAAAGMTGGALPFASSIPIAAAPGALSIGAGAGTSAALGGSSAASTAGSAGAMGGIGAAGAATLGIGAAVAAAAYAWQKNRNSTKNAREDFSKQMGYKNTGQLYSELAKLGPEGEALRQEGLNVIGKKDSSANKIWMEKAAKLLASRNQSNISSSSLTGGFRPNVSNPMYI